MLIWILLIGALASSGGLLFEKIILREKKVNFKHFIVATFIPMVLLMIPLLFFYGRIDPQAWELRNLLILALVVIFSVAANIFAYYAIKWEKLNNLEPVKLLEPVFVILLAFAFFESERDPLILIPTLIAAVALVASHIKKHHIHFNKYLVSGILGSLFFAIEIILSKMILEFYSPLSLYFVRSLFVGIIALVIFRPKKIFKEIGVKERWTILLISALWITYRVLAYWGYQNWGVVFTTLILLLAPVFVYTFARIFLKEKISWRNIVASIVIVLCIVYVNFRQFVF